MSADARVLPVPEGLEGERVDVALARLLGLSRARAGALVAGGGVSVDGVVAGKSDRLLAGALLRVELPEVAPTGGGPAPDGTAGGAPAAPALPVLLEDADVVVVDKPVGVAAHPSPGWDGPTVTGALAAAGTVLARGGAAEREGVVHRLDVGTTGVMVLAKSERAYSDLKAQFRDRTVRKTYHALVQGHPDPARGTVDAPIGRHPTHPHKWAVVAGGRESVTHYETLEAHPAATLVEVHLETGRTHQIRVHMAALRHPCCGDLTYGADPRLAERLGLTRQWLHAVELGFTHPGTGEWTAVAAPYPEDLGEALTRL